MVPSEVAQITPDLYKKTAKNPMPLDSSELTIAQAQSLLAEYSCVTPKVPANAAETITLQNAVKLVAQQTDNQLFGVLADTLEEALTTLAQYTQALSIPMPNPPATPDAPPVYVKLNPGTGLCYAKSYEGTYRGVLISFQSDLTDGLNATYGHLPLNLFS
jgi:Domain of unknown function (DUF1824)